MVWALGRAWRRDGVIPVRGRRGGPRARRKARDRAVYDRALVPRGEITVWVLPEAMAGWRGPVGRRTFAEAAVVAALTLRAAYRPALLHRITGRIGRVHGDAAYAGGTPYARAAARGRGRPAAVAAMRRCGPSQGANGCSEAVCGRGASKHSARRRPLPTALKHMAKLGMPRGQRIG